MEGRLGGPVKCGDGVCVRLCARCGENLCCDWNAAAKRPDRCALLPPFSVPSLAPVCFRVAPQADGSHAMATFPGQDKTYMVNFLTMEAEVMEGSRTTGKKFKIKRQCISRDRWWKMLSIQYNYSTTSKRKVLRQHHIFPPRAPFREPVHTVGTGASYCASQSTVLPNVALPNVAFAVRIGRGRRGAA